MKNQTSRDLGIEHLLIKIQPDPKRISFEQHIIENQLNNKDSIVKDVHPKIAYGLNLKFECMSWLFKLNRTKRSSSLAAEMWSKKRATNQVIPDKT